MTLRLAQLASVVRADPPLDSRATLRLIRTLDNATKTIRTNAAMEPFRSRHRDHQNIAAPAIASGRPAASARAGHWRRPTMNAITTSTEPERAAIALVMRGVSRGLGRETGQGIGTGNV
jgi:hypothetical protein